jgi:hypothetical protein
MQDVPDVVIRPVLDEEVLDGIQIPTLMDCILPTECSFLIRAFQSDINLTKGDQYE